MQLLQVGTSQFQSIFLCTILAKTLVWKNGRIPKTLFRKTKHTKYQGMLVVWIKIIANITLINRELTRISHEWAKRTIEISCSTREIISYFQAFMYCSVYDIKYSPPVNFNAFHNNRHMWDCREESHIMWD